MNDESKAMASDAAKALWSSIEFMEALPDGVVVTDMRGRMVAVNKQTEAIFGYSRHELMGRSVDLLVPMRLRRGHSRHRESYYANPRVRPMSTVLEMYGQRKDGVEIPLDIMLSPWTTEEGALVITVVRDITHVKRLQEQVTQADKLAAIGAMLSGVAHEVINPLTGAIGRAELLLLQGPLENRLRRDVEVIHSEIQRAITTMGDLLLFARTYKHEKSILSINAVLESALALRAYPLHVNGIEVGLDLQPNLPKVLADPHQLQQVFLNIIVNAEQAMTEAHGRGSLHLKARQIGAAIRVTIADDGPGIPKEHLGRIFDPFFTTKSVGQGTGLGLSVSYGIIKEQGGDMRVESEVGKGAMFTIELPVVPQEPSGSADGHQQ